jgi:hypothetical protein
VAALLVPSRRRLEDLRNSAQAASAAAAAGPALADGRPADGAVRAAGPG